METDHKTRVILPAARTNSPDTAWTLALLALPFGYLWFRLLNNLRLEWATDPQYGYGYAVPILCLGLLARRWHRAASAKVESRLVGDVSQPHYRTILLVLFSGLAFLYLPTRLIEGATPEWRPIQWLLGFEVIGLTLCAIYIGKGQGWLKQLAFPICFLFVAVPWPTLVEAPIIQGLARLNAGIVVEVLGILGVPAAQHGNVIEISTGMVGIDDACSGIRSFQSSLMISIFLGEYYWLSRSRRILLVPVCFLLAIAFNVCRTSTLTMIAAKKGTAAIAEYHDAAGFTILLACFATTWGVALCFASRERKKKNSKPQETTGEKATPVAGEKLAGDSTLKAQKGDRGDGHSMLNRFALGLLVWLVVVEAGVEGWYRARESQLKPGPNWSLTFPESNPSFKWLPITEKTRYLLRFNDGQQGQWDESDGTVWQAFYFNWVPGRVAGYLAKRHEPEICLTAAGYTLRSGPELMMLTVHGVELPMRRYVFDTATGPLNVYQCRWEAGANQENYVAGDSARYNLIRAVWTGRGIKGQKVLEVVVSGFSDPEAARQALVTQLNNLIKVESPTTNRAVAASATSGF